MSDLADIRRFEERFSNAVVRFRLREAELREQYRREGRGSDTTTLLERATRRFLVDELLVALEWDPSDPGQLAEEARSLGENGERLYFDYLGVSPETRAPVLLVEAKGFDIPAPRRRREDPPGAVEMSELIAEAVNELKQGLANGDIISDWAVFLRDLHQYVNSLDQLGRTTLQRAVISAGHWMIVFTDPVSTFCSDTLVVSQSIKCYTDVDDILTRSSDVYRQLNRRKLVDVLPLTLDVHDALAAFRHGAIEVLSRALLVASGQTGAMRRRYPTRAVYPALLVGAGDRLHAVVDFQSPLEEPKSGGSFDDFLARISALGAALETRISMRLGVAIEPSPVSRFAGFSRRTLDPGADESALGMPIGPIVESQNTEVGKKIFVVPSGAGGGASEFVIATGTEWFYKAAVGAAASCSFHYWRNAREAGVSRMDAPRMSYQIDSFTSDGESIHCAHDDLLSIREARCHLRPIEISMCCQACVYFDDCWTDDRARLPCQLVAP